jgi:hypothetical protein
MTGANAGYDDEEFDSGDGTARKAVKKRLKQNIQSDLENTGDHTNKLMRIASSGGPSDHRQDANSLEGDARSLDPDHEPRKEGGPTKNIKQSPSVVEINGVADGHQSDAPSIGDREKGRSPIGGNRLQGGLHSQVTDQSDNDDYNSRSGVGLTRENKHTRSNRKIKPMYAMNN